MAGPACMARTSRSTRTPRISTSCSTAREHAGGGQVAERRAGVATSSRRSACARGSGRPCSPPGRRACATGSEVMALRPGDSGNATANAFLAATSFTPVGGTPTAATLAALEPELIAFPQLTFAILATDGGPDCDPALSCGTDQCTSNIDGAPDCPTEAPTAAPAPSGLGCLDGDATTQRWPPCARPGWRRSSWASRGAPPTRRCSTRWRSPGAPRGPASRTTIRSIPPTPARSRRGPHGDRARATASCVFTLSGRPATPTR